MFMRLFMTVTIKNFIQDFKNTVYYNEIYGAPGIILSYVSGSRLIKADSDSSDFDIVVITDSTYNIEDTGIRFKYKDTFTVHFYYRTMEQFLSNTYTGSGNLGGILKIHDLNKSDLIYENEDYSYLINRFFERKNDISKLSMLKYIKNFDYVLTDVYNTGIIDKKYQHKYLYNICYCYYRLTRTKIDSDLLVTTKYCYKNGLSDESSMKVVDMIIALYYINEYYSIEDLVKKFESHRKYILHNTQ